MKKNKINFDLKHGTVEGSYVTVDKEDAPLVIITNGHNGFYNYGMFPYIQEQLYNHGISSFSYNFSHGGIQGDEDYFTELDKYEQNCMRLETADLAEIIKHLKGSEINFTDHTKLILLAHSMGSVPTIFAAKELLKQSYKIDGIVLLSCIKTLNRWPEYILEEWQEKSVYLQKNNRTKQELPQGKELLEEIKQADGKWSLRDALKEVKSNFLIVHGEKDEAVPVEDSMTLKEWVSQYGHTGELHIIPDATHTYNTRHPFEGPSKEVNMMLEVVSEWVNKL